MNFVFPLADSVAISSQTVLSLQIVPISLVFAVRVANRDNRKVQNLSTFLDFGFQSLNSALSLFSILSFLSSLSLLPALSPLSILLILSNLLDLSVFFEFENLERLELFLKTYRLNRVAEQSRLNPAA